MAVGQFRTISEFLEETPTGSYGVYEIRFANGDSYVGQSGVCIRTRVLFHINAANRGLKKQAVHRAIRDQSSSFECRVVHFCQNRVEACSLEIAHIEDLLKSGRRLYKTGRNWGSVTGIRFCRS